MDDMRRQWSEMSRRVEREPIITPEMLRRAVRSDAGKLRRYGWLNVAAGVVLGFFLLWMAWSSDNLGDLLIPLLLFVAGGISVSIYQVRVYMRADDARLSLVERESMLLGYSQFSRRALRVAFAYMASVFGLKVAVDFVRSTDEWWSFLTLVAVIVLLFAVGYALSLCLERWELNRIESLKRSMRELDEFMRDCEEESGFKI